MGVHFGPEYAKLPFRHLIGGITDLAAASDKKPKYVHLLHLLQKLDLVRLPDNGMLYDMTFPKPRAGWTRALEQVALTVDGKMSDSRVVYIQPLANDEDSDTGACYIGFDEVACTVQNFGDLGRTFAKNLRTWTTVAGSRDPRGADHDA